MHFRGTPETLFLLLLAALGIAVLYSLVKRNLESSLPPVFYCAVVAFMSSTGRPVDAPLVMCGLAATLALRFEFMNGAVTNLVWMVAVAANIGILLEFVSEAFGITY
jgi:hypothetical protein